MNKIIQIILNNIHKTGIALFRQILFRKQICLHRFAVRAASCFSWIRTAFLRNENDFIYAGCRPPVLKKQSHIQDKGAATGVFMFIHQPYR